MDREDAPPEARSSPATSYDDVPYSVSAFAQTHPDRLATISTLFGMHPAPSNCCRVLELGCALGGNLIPMAMSSPDSTYVGIDLSPRQIAEGEKMIGELGLKNIQLKAISILEVDDSFGKFDYILTHGVYSWVPPQVQKKILEISSRNLAPQGVAYVSYNALPGWHSRAALREMLWYHTREIPEPGDRVKAARGLLAFLAKSMPEQLVGYGALIRQELEVLGRTPDTYLLHEHLEDFNEPLYFHQFADRAASAGLQYLGEAVVGTMFAGRFGPDVEQTLRQISPDLLHMEQYMDFLRNRMFRQTLLCHANLKLDYALRPESVMKLRIASQAKAVSPSCDPRSSEPAQFRAPGTLTLTTREPLMKAAMVHLSSLWPMSIPFDELLAVACDQSQTSHSELARHRILLAIRLLNCYTTDIVEFSIAPAPFVTHVSSQPIASPYARLRASQTGRVVNMRLEAINLSGPSRELLRLLDGNHGRDDVINLFKSWGPGAILPPATPEDAADQALEGLARIALLVR